MENGSIVRVVAQFPDGYQAIGSGAFVGGNYHVLTAGHVVYSAAHGGYARSIIVQNIYFSYEVNASNQYYLTSTTYQAPAAFWRAETGWIQRGDYNADIGLITLQRTTPAGASFRGNAALPMAAPSDAQLAALPSLVTTGFPGDRSVNATHLYTTTGPVAGYTANTIRSYIDAFNGQSGSPLMLPTQQTGPTTFTQPVVWGVVSNGSANGSFPNNFVRITPSRLQNIRAAIASDEAYYQSLPPLPLGQLTYSHNPPGAGGYRAAAVGAEPAPTDPDIPAIPLPETPPPDTTPPAVVVERAADQPETTTEGTARFVVTFSEPVMPGTPVFVQLGGPAAAGNPVVTVENPADDARVYVVTVTGLTATGVLTVTVPAGAAADIAGNASTASTGAANSVTVTLTPVAPPADLTEGNAATWVAWADQGTATVADDTARKVAGASSIRFETTGPFDTSLRYAAGPGRYWNLSSFSSLRVAVFAENANAFGFQNGSPWVRLIDADGDVFQYQFVTGGNPTDVLTAAIGAWRSHDIPLGGSVAAADGWRRTATGTPDLSRVTALEIHADTWGFGGFRLWVDDLGVRANPLGVTVTQAPGQPDPTAAGTARFVATFAKPVVGFGPGAVALAGPAATGAAVAVANPSGDGRTFEVTISGITAAGQLTARIPAGAVRDADGNGNLESTDADATVTYRPATPAPPPPPPADDTPDPVAIGGAADGSVVVGDKTVSPFGNAGVPVRTASADVNGDGIADIVAVTGAGGETRMAVVSGKDGSVLLAPTVVYAGENFTFGGYVAAGDLDGDGRAEWVVTPELRGGPRVQIFRLDASGALVQVANFFGIGDPSFRDGCRAALGDVNGDGVLDVFVTAAFNGGPRTALFNGADVFVAGAAGRDPNKLLSDFFAAPDGTDSGRGGRSIAAGDVNGDGIADLIVTGDNLLGSGNQITIYSGASLAAGKVPGAGAAVLADFTISGFDPAALASVGLTRADADGKADVAVGSGPRQAARVKVYLGSGVGPGGEPSAFFDLAPFDGAALADGVYVG